MSGNRIFYLRQPGENPACPLKSAAFLHALIFFLTTLLIPAADGVLADVAAEPSGADFSSASCFSPRLLIPLQNSHMPLNFN